MLRRSALAAFMVAVMVGFATQQAPTFAKGPYEAPTVATLTMANTSATAAGGSTAFYAAMALAKANFAQMMNDQNSWFDAYQLAEVGYEAAVLDYELTGDPNAWDAADNLWLGYVYAYYAYIYWSPV